MDNADKNILSLRPQCGTVTEIVELLKYGAKIDLLNIDGRYQLL